ncbi:hypothetical protein ACFX2H_012739 [Malus domestica]
MNFAQNHSRRILPPVASRKRKETPSNGFKLPAPKAPRAPSSTTAPKPPSKTTASPLSANWLLAGHMAYEYLTKGTLFGQKFDPALAEAVPLAASFSAEPRKGKPAESGKGSGTGAAQESYAEVASLLKTDGAHIPGIVNPTQLAKWIQM